LDASSIGTLLLSLSTIAGAKISNPSWVNFQSAGWVSFQSAPTCIALRAKYVLITNPKPCVHSVLPAETFAPKYQTASISTRNS
ncbi:hypothetical protein NLO85_12190, partial [Pseudomonas savastanoi]